MNELAYYTLIWLSGGILLLLAELCSPGLLYFLPFGCGCLGAAALTYCSGSLLAQWELFFVVSGISSVVLRLLLRRHRVAYRSNSDGLIGVQAIVITAITRLKPGTVRVHNEEWAAITNQETELTNNTVVIVTGIKGNRLIVNFLHKG